MDIDKNSIMERMKFSSWSGIGTACPGQWWNQISAIAQKICGLANLGCALVVTMAGHEDLRGFFQP